MKQGLLLIFIVLKLTFVVSQDFEGIVEYETNYTLNSEVYSLEFMEKQFGTKSTTYFKNGFYKELTDSKFVSYQLFRYDKNKIYYKHQMTDDTLRCSSTVSKEILDFTYEIYQKTDTILNVICDKLVYANDIGTKTFYYSSEYSQDPEYYKDYTIINKYDIVKLIKSIYLKLELEYSDFTVQVNATDIKRKKLRKKEFKIPSHNVLIEE